jgi:hypothetical protein
MKHDPCRRRPATVNSHVGHERRRKGIDRVDDILGPISLKGPIPSQGSAEGLAEAAIRDVRFNTATNALFIDLRGLPSQAAARVKTLVGQGTAGASKPVHFLE